MKQQETHITLPYNLLLKHETELKQLEELYLEALSDSMTKEEEERFENWKKERVLLVEGKAWGEPDVSSWLDEIGYSKGLSSACSFKEWAETEEKNDPSFWSWLLKDDSIEDFGKPDEDIRRQLYEYIEHSGK